MGERPRRDPGDAHEGGPPPHLGWGTDTDIYRSVRALRGEFPPRLAAAGPRVLKQNRGNAGQGVWRVERIDGETLRVLEARGSMPHELGLAEFMRRCEPYFDHDGCIVDQPYQARLPDRMIRCYMGPTGWSGSATSSSRR